MARVEAGVRRGDTPISDDDAVHHHLSQHLCSVSILMIKEDILIALGLGLGLSLALAPCLGLGLAFALALAFSLALLLRWRHTLLKESGSQRRPELISTLG